MIDSDMLTNLFKEVGEVLKTIDDKGGKYLTFSLAGEEYGVGILKIKEIIGLMPITTIPKAPSYVKGVINLRGKVIPVIDLRLKFGMEETAYTERTCIIVAEIEARKASVLVGVVVDSVSEVLSIKESDIEETPVFGVRLDTSYILGLGKTSGGVKILIDINKALNGEEVAGLEKAA
jgi:purine-binding chemotaxis protein CheW